MKKAGLIVLFALIAVLSSCKAVPDSNVSDTAEESNIVTEITEIVQESKTEEIITVSPYAVSEFLDPFDNHSWEMSEKPEYVVLHFTSAVVIDRNAPFNLATVRSIFTENSLGIHYIIDRDGIVYCWLPETRAAWHAGKGTFADNEKYTNSMNKYSIGIEMLAIGSKKDMSQYLTGQEYDALNPEFIGYTDAQYESLGKLVRDICERNEIPFDREHVIGHNMYNPSKTDPGELFSYDRLFLE